MSNPQGSTYQSQFGVRTSGATSLHLCNWLGRLGAGVRLRCVMRRLVGAGVRTGSLGRRLCFRLRRWASLQHLRVSLNGGSLCRVGAHGDTAGGGLRKCGRRQAQGHQYDQRDSLHGRLTGSWMSLLNAPGQWLDDRRSELEGLASAQS